MYGGGDGGNSASAWQMKSLCQDHRAFAGVLRSRIAESTESAGSLKIGNGYLNQINLQDRKCSGMYKKSARQQKPAATSFPLGILPFNNTQSETVNTFPLPEPTQPIHLPPIPQSPRHLHPSIRSSSTQRRSLHQKPSAKNSKINHPYHSPSPEEKEEEEETHHSNKAHKNPHSTPPAHYSTPSPPHTHTHYPACRASTWRAHA